jgi:hypothetical protein
VLSGSAFRAKNLPVGILKGMKKIAMKYKTRRRLSQIKMGSLSFYLFVFNFFLVFRGRFFIRT